MVLAERRAFVERYFSANLEDLALYDLVLNTGKITKEQAVDTIVRLAIEMESQTATAAVS